MMRAEFKLISRRKATAADWAGLRSLVSPEKIETNRVNTSVGSMELNVSALLAYLSTAKFKGLEVVKYPIDEQLFNSVKYISFGLPVEQKLAMGSINVPPSKINVPCILAMADVDPVRISIVDGNKRIAARYLSGYRDFEAFFLPVHLWVPHTMHPLTIKFMEVYEEIHDTFGNT